MSTQEVVQEARYAHLVGAARMGEHPETSVVDQFGRTHDIANLFICDGSIMPTQGSANPGLTTWRWRRASLITSSQKETKSSHRKNETPRRTPESDGTLQWDKTSLVLVEVLAGGARGIGYRWLGASRFSRGQDENRSRCRCPQESFWAQANSSIKAE
jgi:hypothetical protein